MLATLPRETQLHIFSQLALIERATAPGHLFALLTLSKATLPAVRAALYSTLNLARGSDYLKVRRAVVDYNAGAMVSSLCITRTKTHTHSLEDVVAWLPNLRALGVEFIGGKRAAVWYDMPSLPSLVSIQLFGLGKATIFFPSDSPPTKLQKLELVNLHLAERSLLDWLPACPQLQSLVITGNKFVVDGLEPDFVFAGAVQAAQALSHLRKLHMSCDRALSLSSPGSHQAIFDGFLAGSKALRLALYSYGRASSRGPWHYFWDHVFNVDGKGVKLFLLSETLPAGQPRDANKLALRGMSQHKTVGDARMTAIKARFGQ